ITADTRLFEDRVIDSLKVLELIAFVQSEIGRKIPDAQIVLANFRSIATIARVFTGGEVVTARRPARRGLLRPRANGSSPVAELFARGDLELTAEGGLVMRGAAASLCDYMDHVVRGWALELGAMEKTFPPDIPVATLDRAGFTSAFPDKLVPGRSPAVCYNHYPSFSDTTLSTGGSIVTAIGRCYRNEYDATSDHPAERLASFTMREIIAVGNDGLVERLRTEVMVRVVQLIKDLALDGVIETATDPFFTSDTRGRMLMQQMLPLKYELRLRVADDGRSVAAASFNNHQQHFGRAFSIRLPSGEYAHSGCVAFGWERWVIAFINQHGANEAGWPLAVEARDGAATT
ncbi:MAG TPA: hypothetical protein VIG78_00145, partial [Gemmatimonadaceae bacterium]